MFDRLLVGRLVLSATAVHGTHQTAVLVREHAVNKGFWSNLAVRNKIEAVIGECGESASMAQPLCAHCVSCYVARQVELEAA
jgi:hypothetical protein